MKRMIGELECGLSRRQLAKIAEGRTVIVRVGDEVVGRQSVLRFSTWCGHVRVNVKDYVWDHGGCMPGEVSKRPADAIGSEGGSSEG